MKYEYNDILCHYGTPRHSGRYPWGSGKKPQRSKDFISRVNDLKSQGFSEREVAEAMGFKSTGELRANITMNKSIAEQEYFNKVYKFKEKGMSNIAIAQRMGVTEGAIRKVLKKGLNEDGVVKGSAVDNTAGILERAVESKGYIDVGKGVDRYLGVGESNMSAALNLLKAKGYEVINLQTPQLQGSNYTTTKVLAPEGTTYKELKDNMDKIELPVEYTVDSGLSVKAIHRPVNLSSDRVMIRYDEDGGTAKDGVIELRPGVQELSMGNSRYAQVRIALDDKYYLKGMAVYNDNMPEGVDIIFNSNKHKGTPLSKVFKEQKEDPDNPFGSSIDRQNDWTDSDGKVHQGALNIVREEGSWGQWKKSLASQVLSKQPVELAKQQLGLAERQSDEEFEEIKSLTNAAVKKKLLLDFADNCDKAAIDLKAAAFPGQASHVILPITSLKETEIYAPNYKDGEEVVLIRYPHGGKFEIPRLKVNNRNAEADGVIGKNASDAVGINSKVAEVLSGADFDGDTVLVIPTKTAKIQSQSPIESLKGFDPKAKYSLPYGMGPILSKQHQQKQMGEVTNLITDMSLQGNYTEEEIARAVRHSMVVIDAYKHKLDYKQSAEDNGIKELREKYQKHVDPETGEIKYGGAGTIISRAKSQAMVTKRDPNRYDIDPITGKKIHKLSSDAYYNKAIKDKDGNVIGYETREKKIKSTKMAEAKDARELIGSDHPMEKVYADYANYMKSLGNQARLEALNTQVPTRDPEAARVYKKEVDSLNFKLDRAVRNAPLERKAQLLANSEYKAKLADNPSLEEDADLAKKTKNACLRNARARTGAKGVEIEISAREWEAIQANAISKTKLESILQKADGDAVRRLAIPKTTSKLSPAKIALAQAMLSSGQTIAEVAEHFGVSSSTLASTIRNN